MRVGGGGQVDGRGRRKKDGEIVGKQEHEGSLKGAWDGEKWGKRRGKKEIL